jgi:hypothetical protein
MMQPIDKCLTDEDVEELFQRILSDENLIGPLRQWELWGARRRAAAKVQGLFWDDDNVVFDEPEPKPFWVETYKSVLREKFGDEADRYLDLPLRARVGRYLSSNLGIED